MKIEIKRLPFILNILRLFPLQFSDKAYAFKKVFLSMNNIFQPHKH